ncbi:MAG: VCBS repeat-containing protein [Deltaproteobacteria bacterium]|nr:VCBS repeat-containing protein [Deltaproteobacteria bacterium]
MTIEKSRKGRRWWLWAMPCLAVVLVAPKTLHDFNTREAEVARFYDLGTSISTFLKGYCSALKEVSAQGPAALADFYSDSYRAPRRGGWQWQPQEPEGQIARWALYPRGSSSDEEAGNPAEAASEAGAGDGKQQALEEVVDYLSQMASIESTACKIDLIEQGEAGTRAVLTVKFVLDGVDHAGRLLEDRSFHRWWLTQEGDASVGLGWRLTDETVVNGVRVAGDGGGFEELPVKDLGIDFHHQRDPKLDRFQPDSGLRFAVMGHAGGGLAVADFDQDGWEDLFFTDGVDSRLYRHQGLGEEGLPRFVDVTEVAGLSGLGQAHSALFGDVDGDRDLDLFVGRYLAPSKLYLNRGDGTFEDRSQAWGVDVVLPASSATFLDYDRDGDLDLYLGAYGNAFDEIPRLPFFAENGGRNALFENDAGSRFTDVTAAAGVGDTGWTLAVTAGDANGDGWPDLAIANDFGKKTLYLNRQDGTFRDATQEAGVLDFSGGMGLAFGDFDGDGDADLYTSNIKSNQRWYGEDMTVSQYLRNVLRTRWAIGDATEYWRLYRLLDGEWSGLGQQTGEGNSLFANQGDGTFQELHDSQTHQAGWSWGVAFADFDNDLDLDLYAANGWISATPGTDL